MENRHVNYTRPEVLASVDLTAYLGGTISGGNPPPNGGSKVKSG